MSLLDRVQKQQAPDPNAPPDGAYVPQAGQTPTRQTLAAATRARTPFEQQAERIKNRLQARLIEESANDSGDEDREQRAAKITDAMSIVIAEMGLSLTQPGEAAADRLVFERLPGAGSDRGADQRPHDHRDHGQRSGPDFRRA